MKHIENLDRIEIIMTTWNAVEYSKRAILSLIAYTDLPFNFTVVDNGSKDGTLDFLREITPTENMKNFRLIANVQNVGIPIAQNSAYIHDAHYTCITNNDIIFSKNWLSKMIQIMKGNSEIGMLGTMIPSIFYKHPYCNEDLRTVIKNTETGSNVEEELHNYILGREYDSFVEDVIKVNGEKTIEFNIIPYYIVTCCALINNKIMNEVGGLADEQFTKYGSDDIDQAWRILNAGYKIAITNEVYIHHFRHKSIGSNENNFNRNKYLLINNIKFFIKWHKQIKNFIDSELKKGVDVNEKISKLSANKYWFLVGLNNNIGFWSNGGWNELALNESLSKLIILSQMKI